VSTDRGFSVDLPPGILLQQKAMADPVAMESSAALRVPTMTSDLVTAA
jgi:hypothetical protein